VLSGNVSAEPKQAKNWVFMPDANGLPHFVDTSDKQTQTKFFLQYFSPDSKIFLWLYNK
jgi:hypothetical protein